MSNYRIFNLVEGATPTLESMAKALVAAEENEWFRDATLCVDDVKVENGALLFEIDGSHFKAVISGREIHLYARNDESELGTDGATQFIKTMNRIGCTKAYVY
ncbi:hypothetical protein MBO12_01320 [Candidatus Saccharibacteria bacterium]|jgi:ectoine hydroxylase-related dioxygenase (phytanoyl-CoA dioxygenase family)|nr:hypothetical protein [Candidatus Saccharibacteria bacterium]